MKNEHNGVSICDRLESGWTIEGYPEPLTEAVEEVAELFKVAKAVTILEEHNSFIANKQKWKKPRWQR